MIFVGGHLGFFQISYIGMTLHVFFLRGFIRLFHPENIGVDTTIMILCQLGLDVLSKLDFHDGHFEK